jgi:hypothetical protein
MVSEWESWARTMRTILQEDIRKISDKHMAILEDQKDISDVWRQRAEKSIEHIDMLLNSTRSDGS